MRFPGRPADVFRNLATAALLLSLCVVVLGAFVRLSDAGLGCPDWPGCYGHPVVPESTALFPERPLEPGKAWKEMIHRYAAGILGLLILALFFLARRHPPLAWARPVTGVLLALVIFQALLGMWTVTLKLQPVIVMAHLLGGLGVASTLLLLVLGAGARRRTEAPPGLVRWGRAATAVLFLQVILGGWTSANYAAPACSDFPQCQGQWWPTMDFSAALKPELPPEAGDYEGGTLDAPARAAIHVAHRIGAVLAFTLLGALALVLILRGGVYLRHGLLLATALLVQVTVGIAMVLFQFPLVLAVAHNAGALLLVLTAVHLLFHVRSPGRVPVGRKRPFPNPRFRNTIPPRASPPPLLRSGRDPQ